jgi:hypothetical protein
MIWNLAQNLYESFHGVAVVLLSRRQPTDHEFRYNLYFTSHRHIYHLLLLLEKTVETVADHSVVPSQ